MINRRLFLVGTTASGLLNFSHAVSARANQDYRLIAKPSVAQLLESPEPETKIWGYNGKVPGPVIRIKKGSEVSIEVVNQLDQPTSVHWHGIRIDNAMDGVSNLTQEPIQPGDSFIYRFSAPDAGTYWYHPHNRTWEQLARGMYGTLIVEGDMEVGDLDRDFPIVADDWLLEEAGSIHEASFGNLRDWSHAGRLGNILTLNGKPYENLYVIPGERVRLRFINTANARIMRFGLEGHEPWLVALDGQPIEPKKLSEDGIEISPSQRADLIMDVEGNSGDKFAIMETSGRERLVAGYINLIDGVTKKRQDEIPMLVSNQIPEPDIANATKLQLLMSGGAMRFLTSATYRGTETDGRTLARTHKQLWAFNGQAGMSEKPFFSAKQGETISLKLINETAWPHAIHLHGHHFRVLKKGPLSSQKLAPIIDEEKNAFRDTVLVQRDEIVEIAFVADNPGKWMLHCHMLEHQASGMGTWFEVFQ